MFRADVYAGGIKSIHDSLILLAGGKVGAPHVCQSGSRCGNLKPDTRLLNPLFHFIPAQPVKYEAPESVFIIHFPIFITAPSALMVSHIHTLVHRKTQV